MHVGRRQLYIIYFASIKYLHINLETLNWTFKTKFKNEVYPEQASQTPVYQNLHQNSCAENSLRSLKQKILFGVKEVSTDSESP